MPSPARSIPPPFALLLLYATSGLLWGVWIQRLPAVTRHLDLTQSQLGVVLPAFPIGALVAFQIVSALSTRFESRTMLRIFGVMRAAVFPLLGLATDMPTLMGALALSGFAQGGLEVSLNAQGVAVERQLGRPILARGAAANSIGTLISSGGVWLTSRADLPYLAPFLLAATVGLLMFPTFTRELISDAPAPGAAAVPARRVPWPPPALWALLVIAFISEILDETISEWVGIYLGDDLGSGPAVTTLGYSFYTAALLAGRLLGDPVSGRISPVRILQIGGLVGGLGMLFGVGLDTKGAILIGSGVIGLGTSLMLPTLYRLAGSTPGMPSPQALAMVSTTVYLGYMVGPMVIGPISGTISLRAALLIVGLICFAIPVVAGMIRVPAPAPTPAEAGKKYA